MNFLSYCWWFRNPIPNHLGCIKSWKSMGSTTNLHWWVCRIFWTPTVCTFNLQCWHPGVQLAEQVEVPVAAFRDVFLGEFLCCLVGRNNPKKEKWNKPFELISWFFVLPPLQKKQGGKSLEKRWICGWGFTSVWSWIIYWIYAPHSNSHHQDYDILSRESLYKASFAIDWSILTQKSSLHML